MVGVGDVGGVGNSGVWMSASLVDGYYWGKAISSSPWRAMEEGQIRLVNIEEE